MKSEGFICFNNKCQKINIIFDCPINAINLLQLSGGTVSFVTPRCALQDRLLLRYNKIIILYVYMLC